MSGIAGSPPTSTYPSLTVPLVTVTGVAARTVGYTMAAILIVLAFLPKINGALLSIPNPVMGGFLLFAIGLLFIEGIQTLLRAGLDTQKAMVVGLAFSFGLGMQHYNLIADFLPDPWGILLGNGITVGAATAIAFTALLNLSNPRALRLETRLNADAYPEADQFLQKVANDIGWAPPSTERLRAAAEETITTLVDTQSETPIRRSTTPSHLGKTRRVRSRTRVPRRLRRDQHRRPSRLSAGRDRDRRRIRHLAPPAPPLRIVRQTREIPRRRYRDAQNRWLSQLCPGLNHGQHADRADHSLLQQRFHKLPQRLNALRRLFQLEEMRSLRQEIVVHMQGVA